MRLKPLKSVVCFGAVMFALVACDRPVNRISHGLPMPAQTFAHVERLPVAVASVQIERGDGGVSGRSGDFSVSLHEKAMLYLSRKFEARGYGDGHLVVLIEGADVSHVQKQSRHGILSRIGVDRVDEYDLALVLRLEYRDVAGRLIAGEALRVRKRFSVSEHDSLAKREQKQFQAVEEMFVVLDPQVGRVIRSDLNL